MSVAVECPTELLLSGGLVGFELEVYGRQEVI